MRLGYVEQAILQTLFTFSFNYSFFMDLMNKMVKKIARLRDKRICGYVTQRDQIWWYPSAQEVTRNPFSMFIGKSPKFSQSLCLKCHLAHKRQTQGPRAESGLHLVVSGPAPPFYLVAAPSPRLTVQEQLHVHSPNVSVGPLKATARLMWPPVKMSLTALI